MKEETQRPNPETLLKRVQAEELAAKRGKLKIYLGSAPGVGKTYTMLKDALDQRAKGLDIIVGVAESHGREEISALLDEFEILPRQIVSYRNQSLLEFDLDAALKRNPGICLIDEMAHTNAPGLRHAKRWQDINEILDHGIDVYTTLNVQHIESLNDVISRIIETHIKETVPDSALELANTIELVDLPPEDLLKRLDEGKIYFPQQADIAKENFFRKGNLAALRELALRVTAERVGVDVFLYREGEGIKRIWPTREKILVCVGPGNESLKLIRKARRMAVNLHAEWIAVYVDTPKLKLSDTQQNKAIQHLRFAEQMGADTCILTGFDVVKEIMSFAREQNVTQIMVWKQIRSRWHDIIRHSLADDIVRQSGEINVFIITPDTVHDNTEPKTLPSSSIKTKAPWKMYGVATILIVSITLLNFILTPFLATNNLIMIYLLGITLIALFGRTGPSVFSCIISVILYDFFFIPPVFSFAISDIQYVISLVIMLVVAMIISHLTIQMRRQTALARKAERYVSALHNLSRRLTQTRDVRKMLNVAASYLADLFDSKIIILLPKEDHLVVRASYKTEKELSIKEQGVAQWVYKLGQLAGLGTDTLSFSKALYLPLMVSIPSQKSLGVLRIRPKKSDYQYTSEQMQLLQSCTNLIALALESNLNSTTY